MKALTFVPENCILSLTCNLAARIGGLLFISGKEQGGSYNKETVSDMQCNEKKHEETPQRVADTTEDNQRRECSGEKQRPSLSDDPRTWSPGNHEGSYE